MRRFKQSLRERHLSDDERGHEHRKPEPEPEETPLEETVWQSVEERSTIEPFSNHTLDATADIGLGVAEMCGYKSHKGGFDSMSGIDLMVMGHVDSMQELRTESNTPGGPLDLGPFETIFSDDVGFGDMNLDLAPEEDPKNFDWCSCL